MRRLLPALFGLFVAVPLFAALAPAEPLSIMRMMAPGPLPEMTLGDPAAPVTVVEYVSLTCSHCADFHRTTFEQLKTGYIDQNKVYYVLREFPLDPLAFAAIMAARCASEDQFFPIVQGLFREQDNWAFVDNPAAALKAKLQPYGFSDESFAACLNRNDLADKIIAVSERAENDFDVHGTPTFFINGERHVGAIDPAELDGLLKPLLGKN